jgi:type IV secretion system protein VirB5
MRIRQAALALLAASLLISAGEASAQQAVIDNANLTQALNQVRAWGQQYGQMTTQIQNQLALANSLNGVRNLGQIYNNIRVTATVPKNLPQLLQQTNSMAGLATQVATVTTSTLATTEQRGYQIQQLMASIAATRDPKAIAEVQARMAAEQAAVGNDANRIAIMDIQQRAQQQLIDQQLKAQADAMVSSNKITVPNFSQQTLGH